MREAHWRDGAAPTRLTLENKLWGPRLSRLCSVPRGRPETCPNPRPPTYTVQTCQQRTGDQCWAAELTQCKRLVRLRRTIQLFCNFHSVSKDKKGRKPDIWSKKAVTRMLQLHLKDRFRDKFNNRFSKKKQVWDELAKALNAHLMLAAPVNGEQCDTKSRILQLKKKYLDCIEKNNKTGTGPKCCDHYELLDEIWVAPIKLPQKA